MEEAGLLARRRARDNERVVQVLLTDAGKARLGECGCLNALLGERWKYSHPNLGHLNRLLQQLLADLDVARVSGQEA